VQDRKNLNPAVIVWRGHTRQGVGHAIIALVGKFREGGALDAAHVLRGRTRTPGHSVSTVLLERLARQECRERVVVVIAQRDHLAVNGPARVSTAEEDELRRMVDHRAQTVLPESTKSVRPGVKIAQPENFLGRHKTLARIAVGINILDSEAPPVRTVRRIRKGRAPAPQSRTVAATPDTPDQTAGCVRLAVQGSTARR
jgi:hypothetical protein